MITLPQPQGLIERLTPEALPPGAAASAVNVDLSAGSIKALNVTATTALWTQAGSEYSLTGEAPETEIAGPAKPTAAPTLKALAKICQPATGTTLNWMTIAARGWHVYDRYTGTEPNGELIEERVEHSLTVTIRKVQDTPTGFKIHGTFGGFNYTATAATVYRHFGPNVQITLSADASGKGGPSAAEAGSYPNTPTFSDPPVPGGSWSLYDNDASFGTGQIYGHLRCAALEVEPWEESYTAAQNGSKYCYGMDFVLTFDCEYSPGAVQQIRLVSAGVDADGREGPPSEESDLLTLPPGTRPTFTLADAPSGGTRRLYVSGKGTREWRLWADEDEDSGGFVGDDWTDDGRESQPVPVPPYGDYSGTGFTSAADLKKWSVMMGDFAVCLVDKPTDSKVELWPSDATRLHSWPEEWVKVIPATPRKGIASLGTGEALIFAGGEVWLASGSDPRAIGLRKLSTEHGLLDLRSLCRIGSTVFWVTYTGLAACEGGEVRLVSEPFISPEQWRARSPEKYTAKTDGVSVILTHEGAGSNSAYNRRFLIRGGQVESVVAWTALTGGTPSWQSGVVDAGRPVILDARRTVANESFSLEFTADGTASTQTLATVTANRIASLSSSVGPARRWQFKLTGSSTATEIRQPVEFYERKIIDVPEGGLTVTPEMVEGNWGDVWLKFSSKGRFVAGMVNGQATPAKNVKLSFDNRAKDGTNAYSVTATPGGGFRLAHANNKDIELWRLSVSDVDGQGNATALTQPIEGVTLYTPQVRRVEGMLRETAGGTGVKPWWVNEYQFDGWVTSAKVLHVKDGAVALTGEMAGDAVDLTTDLDGTLTTGVERLLDVPLKAGRLSFYFGADDDAVQEIQIGTQQVIEAGGGVIRIGRGHMRGNLIHFPDRGAFSCYSVGARNYSGLTLALRQDFAAHYSASVTGGKAVLLPRDKQSEGSVFQADLKDEQGNAFELLLMARQRVPVSGKSLSLTANDTGIPPWWTARYEMAGAQELTSVVVKADSYPVTLWIYRDGVTSIVAPATEVAYTAITVSGPEEIAVRDFGTVSAFDFDFGGTDDYKVNEVGLFFREVAEVGEGGATFSGPFPIRRRFVRFANQGKFSAAIAKARGYSNASLSLYRDGTQVDLDAATAGTQALAVTSGRPIILPRDMDEGELWEADFANADVTDSLALLCRRVSPVKGTIHEIVKADGLYPWLLREYDPEERADYVSALVLGVSGTLTAYRDGAAGVAKSFTDGVEFALTGLDDCGRIAFDLGGDDLSAKEVFLFARIPVILKQSVLLRKIDGVYNFLNRRLRSEDRPKRLATARVLADSYPVTLTFSSGGSALCNAVTVTSPKAVTLPRMEPRREIDVSASGARIEELGLSVTATV